MNGTEIYKFKVKDSEIVATPLCLGNILKDGYVCDFSVDYDATDVLMILKTFISIWWKKVT